MINFRVSHTVCGKNNAIVMSCYKSEGFSLVILLYLNEFYRTNWQPLRGYKGIKQYKRDIYVDLWQVGFLVL